MNEMEPLNEIVTAPIRIAERVVGRVAEEAAVLPIRAAEKTVEVAAHSALKLTGYAARSVMKMGVDHAKRSLAAAMSSQQRGRGMER